MPTEVDSSNWEVEVATVDMPVMVEFIGPDCSYCDSLAETVKELISEYHGRIRFVTVNVMEAGDIAALYGVMSIPMVKFFCSGREVSSILGNVPKKTLRGEIEKMLSIYTSCLAMSTDLRKDPMYS